MVQIQLDNVNSGISRSRNI